MESVLVGNDAALGASRQLINKCRHPFAASNQRTVEFASTVAPTIIVSFGNVGTGREMVKSSLKYDELKAGVSKR